MARTPKPIRRGRTRMRMALRSIDPTWSGAKPMASTPPPLPGGADPVGVVLARRNQHLPNATTRSAMQQADQIVTERLNRYGGFGSETFPTDEVGLEVWPPVEDPSGQNP